MAELPNQFDPAHLARFYDDYGEQEWLRFDRRLCDRVSLEIHRNFLSDFVRKGDRVLDAGAGPGRFTIDLVRLGATVVVGDISPEQLRLNEEKVKEATAEAAIESRELLDISDLSRFEDESFDVVVCFGGPLSYVFDGASGALARMARVLKPGGRVLVSVMSRLGTHRMALREILGAADALGNTAVESVFESGDLPPSLNKGHGMRMYRFAEFEALLNESGFEVVAASASNGLTIGADELGADPEQLAMVIRWEQVACRSPGALDWGTHIIAAAVRR